MTHIKIADQQPIDPYLKAVFNNENGADYELLVMLMAKVTSGAKIAPDFQKVANAIVARAILCGSLPPKKKGRPKEIFDMNGYEITWMYFNFRDGGMGYAEAVAKVSEAFNKEERQIMRLVKQYKEEIGETKECREKNYEWWLTCVDKYMAAKAEGREPIMDLILSGYEDVAKEMEELDLLGELDTVIEDALTPKFTTVIK